MDVSPLHSEIKKIKNQAELKRKLVDNQSYYQLLKLNIMIDKLFENERQFQKQNLNPEQIFKNGNDENIENSAKNIVRDIFEYGNKISYDYQEKSKAGKALFYLLNNKDYLKNYLNNR